MTSIATRTLLLVIAAVLLPSCAPPPPPPPSSLPLSMPDDATFAMVRVGVPDAQGDADRRERLEAFERNLKKQLKGSFEEYRIRCVHCANPAQSPTTELRYVFIREHTDNMDRFNKAWRDTWEEKRAPTVVMSVQSPAPGTPPDCPTTCGGQPCTCMTYAYCPSGCKKVGQAACCVR